MINRVAHVKCFLVVLLVQTITGCMSLEEMAPPVGPQFESMARTKNTSMALLESGRQVYLVDCSRCHSIEPIRRYSKTKWHDIISRMAPKSKLSHTKSQALQAYILAVSDMTERETELN